MSEVVKSDVVEGTVLDAAEPMDLTVRQSTVEAYSEVSPEALSEAVSAGPEAVEAFKAKLSDVYSGSSLMILKATHAQTVASAYMVRLCDTVAEGEQASPEVVIAELAKMDPTRPEVSKSRVTQYRNAASVLIDLGFASSDARVGQFLNLTTISKPLSIALDAAKESTEAGQAKFLELAGEALEKQKAAKAKRAVTSGTTQTGTTDTTTTDAPTVTDTQGSDGADTGSREPNLATDKGNGKDGVLLAIGELPVATVEDIARLYVLQHAIEFRISQADEAIREAARKLADVETEDADKAAATLARKASARKATPKPGPRKSAS